MTSAFSNAFVTGSNGKPQPLASGLMSLPPGPLNGSYQYRGGLTLDDRGDLPLAADFSFLHSGGSDALYLDGHVKFVSQSNWVPVSHGPFPQTARAEGRRLSRRRWTASYPCRRPHPRATTMEGSKMRTRTGFTFLELIVSLSLIMALVALLFPVFARTRESARRTSCGSNLHQIATACHLYAMDNGGLLPPDAGGSAWTS